VFAIPATDCARHMVIVGATGAGKTNLMICKDLFIILDKAAAQGYSYLVARLDSNVRVPPNMSALCPFPAVGTGRYPDFSLMFWLP
jgi:hypothetical protein